MSVNSKMTAIADAIRNLIDISGTMGLDAMASNISSITKRGAVAGTISEKSEQYIIPSGYHNGSGTVEISPDEQSKIIAENIKNGVTILGVAGSASGEIYSVIAVTYPEGSVCTCTNGTKTLTAKDTSGKALFNVTVGEWTVTATDGSSTASQAVSITADGQSESVSLRYALVLFDNGSQVPWTAYNEAGKPTGVVIGEESIDFKNNVSYRSAATTDSYDMTPYKTAHLIGNVNTVFNTDYNNIPRFMVTNNVYYPENYGLAHKTFSDKGPVSLDLDISNITGSHKIEIWGTFYGKITQVWLTED